jgi:hypothetical protein
MANEPITTKDEDERKKGGAAAVAFRGAQTASRVNSGVGWLNWLLGGYGTNALGIVAIGGLLGLTGIAASQPDYLPGLFGFDKPVQVVTKHWGNSVVFPIDGVDRAGRKAGFDFVIKTQDISWVRGATDQVALKDKPIAPGDVNAELFGPEVQAGLAPSADLIAVGMASQEGVASDEIARAERRGVTSASWMSKAVGAGKKMWALNLGQFKSACSDKHEKDTSWERPYLMIGVRSQDPGVNLSEALANAMAGKTNLPSTECYSNYRLGKVS